MKTVFRIVLLFVSVVCLASCDNNLKHNDYQGDWYLNRAITEIKVGMMGYNYNQANDTSFVENMTCFSLTDDNWLLVEGDTLGSYVYDELEGTLSVHSTALAQLMGGSDEEDGGMDISEYLDGIDLENLVLDVNYTKKAAKCTLHKSGAGTAMGMVPYSFDLSMQLYLQREKK